LPTNPIDVGGLIQLAALTMNANGNFEDHGEGCVPTPADGTSPAGDAPGSARQNAKPAPWRCDPLGPTWRRRE